MSTEGKEDWLAKATPLVEELWIEEYKDQSLQDKENVPSREFIGRFAGLANHKRIKTFHHSINAYYQYLN